MNCPATPGHNNMGKNAANVVPVDATIGQNIRLDAFRKASLRGDPLSVSFLEYSTITIAPSTSIPTVRTRPNSTIIFTVIPSKFTIRKLMVKVIGIPIPTSSAGPTPKTAITVIMTSTTAVKIAASSDFKTSKIFVD